MPANIDAVFYCRTVPQILVEDGHFHICYDVGRNARFEIVLPPHVYFKALKRANQAADEFHDNPTVVPIKSKR